jgi:predicted nucleic acid-binding protein
MELVQGCRNRLEIQRVRRLVRAFRTYWPSAPASDAALELHLKYVLSHNLDAFDALIAATAIGLNATLCTFNVKHFRPLTGLQTEQPYEK